MIDNSNIIEKYLPRIVIGIALLGLPAGIASRYYDEPFRNPFQENQNPNPQRVNYQKPNLTRL